jgi:hypothetical protein
MVDGDAHVRIFHLLSPSYARYFIQILAKGLETKKLPHPRADVRFEKLESQIGVTLTEAITRPSTDITLD